MAVHLRRYDHATDYDLVSQFLIAHYQPGNRDGNYLEPAWEYMHHHPAMDPSAREHIGIWEEGGEIVGVVHPEWKLGEAFFEFHPDHLDLREKMLDYAEADLYGRTTPDGPALLKVWVNDFDEAFLTLVAERGYEHVQDSDWPMARLTIPDPFPAIELPSGYELTSLADEPDWAKVHRALWRGFDHEGEPPGGQEELDERRAMFDTPKARRDLKIAVRAPQGDFVAFCGTFYEPNGRFCYVEPVATDPAYRRKGLGRAAVLEGIRRCGALGATDAYVGSNQQFYLSLGFQVIYTSQCWRKELEPTTLPDRERSADLHQPLLAPGPGLVADGGLLQAGPSKGKNSSSDAV
jgi:GNAT superfamily N-acetyltransferase